MMLCRRVAPTCNATKTAYLCRRWMTSGDQCAPESLSTAAFHADSESALNAGCSAGCSADEFGVVVEDAGALAELRNSHATTGASVKIVGCVAPRQGAPSVFQSREVHAERVEVIGECDGDAYPLQKKYHSLEFLRDHAHLRCRSNTLGASMRVRNTATHALHNYFQTQGFIQLHAPVITSLDCEGAGDMFAVETRAESNQSSTPFFDSPAYLTVSAQLYGEMGASSFPAVYSFGPTFRAENSHTSRHLAEFWMLEPEMAFSDLSDVLRVSEESIKHTIAHVKDQCVTDLEFFTQRIDKSLLDRLDNALEHEFARMTYTEAIDILRNAMSSGAAEFKLPVEWNSGLHSEHERFLAERHCGRPVFVTDYPKAIKPFYMRCNDARDDEPGMTTVAAVDLLVPIIGELVGGGQREERFEHLRRQMAQHGLDETTYQWYLDLRRFGSVPHAGFGLGFERLLMFLTGLSNIRDVTLAPRTLGALKY